MHFKVFSQRLEAPGPEGARGQALFGTWLLEGRHVSVLGYLRAGTFVHLVGTFVKY